MLLYIDCYYRYLFIKSKHIYLIAEHSSTSDTESESTSRPNVKSTEADAIPEKYHPPVSFKFPTRTFGVTRPREKRCSHKIFADFTWLHYVTATDVVLCHTCMTAEKKSKLTYT